MLFTELLISGIAVVVAFSLFLFNLFKRFRFTLNRIFAVIAFLSSLLFLILFLLLMDVDLLPVTVTARIYFALILVLSDLFFHLIQIYPDKELKPKIVSVLITAIPSVIFSVLTVLTDKVVYLAEFSGYLDFQFGDLFPVYLLLTSFYLLGSLFIILYKSRFTIESRVLSQEIRYVSYGISVSVILLLLFSFFLPTMIDLQEYRNLGIAVPGMFILIIMNYAVFDIRVVDFKKFNIRILYWFFISTLLFVPVYLLFRFKDSIFAEPRFATVGIAIASFLYLFFFYRYASVRILNVFQREYRSIEQNFNEFFQSIVQVSMVGQEDEFWQRFYTFGIDGFRERFHINNGAFYLYNPEKNVFEYVHGFSSEKDNSKVEQTIDIDDLLIDAVKKYNDIVDRSLVYSDMNFYEIRYELLSRMDQVNAEILMPFLNFHGEIVAFLILGPLPGDTLYSTTFLDALELYRIQFQHLLTNALVLEEVKEQQVLEHDHLVVSFIKKRLQPPLMQHVEGIRVSAFTINNMKDGGDYYDSIHLGRDAIALFIADIGSAGVASAVTAMQLYAVLHGQLSMKENSSDILNAQNRVLSSARYNSNTCRALCFVYDASGVANFSSASYGPLVIFDSSSDEFTQYALQGKELGVDDSYSYGSKDIPVPPRGIGIIYSDGLMQVKNSAGVTYSEERLKDIVRMNSTESPAVLTRKVYTDIQSFSGETEMDRDVTVIIFARGQDTQ